MQYTVKQLARIAGVTPRTLHFYDEIQLLLPSSYGDNGYRYYDEGAVLRLQQIMFFRELDFSLEEIKEFIESPDFDLLQALQVHRKGLQARVNRLDRLIETVDRTIQHLRGEIQMSSQDFYTGFDEEKQERYAVEAEKRWGETAATSQKRWKSYSPARKNEILGAMHDISANIAANMEKGPASAEVQHWVDRWFNHINQYFYTCTLEIFESLGHMYVQDPAFQATYENVRPGMAAFMEEAMTHYCKMKTAR